MVNENVYFVKHQQQTRSFYSDNKTLAGLSKSIFSLICHKLVTNNFDLSICGVKVSCPIRKFKITKLRQQVMPTYCHIDSTDVVEINFTIFIIFISINNSYLCTKRRKWSIIFYKTRYISMRIRFLLTAVKIKEANGNYSESLMSMVYHRDQWVECSHGADIP
jgi:hypothetical protein